MGINSNCYLPNDIRAGDIVEAIAFLCGAKRIKSNLQGGSFASSHNWDEVQTRPDKKASHVYVLSTHDIQYFTIQIAPTNCDKIWHEGSLFLAPQTDHPNRYCLYGGVSEFWNKIDRALVDLFGGEIDDNDCDSVDIDYQKEKPRLNNAPSNGEEWEEFQNALLSLPTLFKFID